MKSWQNLINFDGDALCTVSVENENLFEQIIV